jgi:hypothetical protein
VVNGASWQYAGDWSVHGPLSLTRGFAEIGADGFTEQDVWSSGLTRTARMTCDGGNIQAIDLGTVVGTVSSTSIQLVADDVIADGFVLPAGVSPGDTWTQTLDITGKAVISENVSAPAHNEAAISCTAGQSESITVAAGTFDAIRIDCEVKMHVTVAVPAINEVTQDITSVTSAWLAPGVGLVRTQAESDLEDYSYELVSYEIP